MSLRHLAIAKDLKFVKVVWEKAKTLFPQAGYVLDSLNSKAILKNHLKMGLSGFRLARLTKSGCEVIVPNNWLNQDSQNRIEQTALINAAHFAAEIFWYQINPEPHLWEMSLKSSYMEIIGAIPEKLRQIRLKTSVTFEEKENLFFALREHHEGDFSLFFDGMSMDEQLLCQIELKFVISGRPQMALTGQTA